MAADAISAARPGARRENMESYIKRLETLEALCNGFEGVESSYAVQAGREVRILVQPDKVSDDQVILLGARCRQKDRERAWIIPARSRSASSAKAALPSTQNNFRSLPLAGGLLFYYSAPSGWVTLPAVRGDVAKRQRGLAA